MRCFRHNLSRSAVFLTTVYQTLMNRHVTLLFVQLPLLPYVMKLRIPQVHLRRLTTTEINAIKVLELFQFPLEALERL